MKTTRSAFTLVSALAALFAASCANVPEQKFDAPSEEGKSAFLVPHKQLTNPPKAHWFAYYDKLETDPTGRFVLAMGTDFEDRTPTDADRIEIGMVDTKTGEWISLGKSDAWGWQQGCQLQFIPKSGNKIIWNDREGGKFVSRIMDVETRQMRTIPSPIYALSPDGKWAITVDYSRVNDMRAGYGYKGIPDKFADEKAPKDAGIWKVDLETGESRLIVSLADAVAIANPYDPDFAQAKHWFNHLLVSPDGKRFIFLHRWKYADDAKNEKYKKVGGFGTRMFTADADGGNLRIIDPYNYTSHFIWTPDSKAVLAWTKIPPHGDGFFVIEDTPQARATQIGRDVMTRNGHCTYISPKWVLNDTYPDKDAVQTVYLFNTQTGERTDIAKLHMPKRRGGEFRCDTHPRSTPDGKKVIVDSAHSGKRQLYMLDISDIAK